MIIMPETLLAIVAAGGGIDTHTEMLLPNTMKALAMAAAAHPSKPRIVFRVNSMMMPQTFTEVAQAGDGCVVFVFPSQKVKG